MSRMISHVTRHWRLTRGCPNVTQPPTSMATRNASRSREKCLRNDGSMLDQRLGRWSDIEPALLRNIIPLGSQSPHPGSICSDIFAGCETGALNIYISQSFPVANSPDMSIYRNESLSVSFKNKWNESGFRPPLCTYRLNWARRTSWGWWDDWGDTVLQTQDSKFEIRALAVWGRARYLSVTEAPHNTDFFQKDVAKALNQRIWSFTNCRNTWDMRSSQVTY